ELETYLKENFSILSVTRKIEKRIGSEALMLSGRVRSGQKINAKHHLILLGDVNPGAELIAGGDILIMGSFRGIASAGQPDNEDAIVLALDFRPTQIQIAKLMAAGLPSSPHRKHPEFAYIDNGVIVVEEYLEANPFGRLPRIETR
ncbi:MAG: septum site-determining protein MinC, partial [Desulfobacteraceae bacterium]|nr:septum site-determining protein MinC [Desulfobacteraceae bacterium]